MSRLGKFSYPTSPAVLAVDGGNSKTDVVLVGPAGEPLGTLPPFEVPSPWWQEVAGVLSQRVVR